ncbi:2 TM domain-containing transmembrane protein [Acrasis kona]|uniref:2 TM domain-containing transmembrane protein n=1 Tax=Acrasis kona TaxID=1008807 RepID=A0AAW2YMD3_9EUKA
MSKKNDTGSSDTQSSGKTHNNILSKQNKKIAKPTLVDYILLIIGILVLVLCLAGGLTGYFVMQSHDDKEAAIAFQQTAAAVVSAVNTNIKLATNDLLVLRNMMTVFDDIKYYTQFLPTVLSMASVSVINGSVVLPSFISAYAYIQIVKYDDLTNFTNMIHSWGGDYSNLAVPRNSNNNTQMDVVRPEYFLVAQNIPFPLLSAINVGASPGRNITLNTVRSTGAISVTTKVSIIGVPGQSGTLVYAPVIKNNVTVGFVGTSLVTTNLLKSSSSLGLNEGLVMFDLDGSVMAVVTNGFNIPKIGDDYSLDEVQSFINNVPLSNGENNVTLYNRRFKIVYFHTEKTVNYLKIVPLGVCLFVALLTICILVFISFYRRFVVSKRIQEVTRNRIEVLENHRAKLSSLLKKSIKSEAKASGIINAIRDIVVVIDISGRIMQSNKSFDKLFEFSEREWSEGVLLSSIIKDLPPLFFADAKDEDIKTKLTLRDESSFEVEIMVSSLSIEDFTKKEALPEPAIPTPNNQTTKNQRFEFAESGEESYVILIRRL